MLNLYESEEFARVSGPSLRPGGTELTAAMLDLCAFAPNAAVLDAGCGLGTTLALLESRGLQPYGLDISAGLLTRAAKAAPTAVLREADAQDMPFADAMFAGVLGECALSLMDDPAAMLGECRRVLQADGLLCLSDIYIREKRACGINNSLSNLKCCLKGALQQSDLIDLIENNGFSVMRFEDHTKLLKQLTAELIFAHGSLQAFWEFFLGAAAAQTVGSCGHKYGYYMLVAHKRT